MPDLFTNLAVGPKDGPCRDCGPGLESLFMEDPGSALPSPAELTSAIEAARAVNPAEGGTDAFVDQGDPFASERDPMEPDGAASLGQLVTLLEQYPGLRITLSFG